MFNLIYRAIGFLLLIYMAISIIAVAITLKENLIINSNFKRPTEASKYVIAIFEPNRAGEKNQALMVKEAAEKMGHSVAYVYGINTFDLKLFLPAKYLNEILIAGLDYYFKTDFRLAISFHVNLSLPEPKIMYISVPSTFFHNKIMEDFPEVRNYDSFIDINLLTNDLDSLSPIIDKKIERSYGLVGIPAKTYQSSPHKKLVFFGSLWGRNSNSFQQALLKLLKQDYMYLLNPPFIKLNKNQPVQFTERAPNFNKLQELLNKHGIALCIHSTYHIEAQIPSSRIFEIISSGAIAISDKNPFVMKYFGNNVLYFDSKLPAEEIFKQIDTHVHWIQNNPEKAEIMAQNAYKTLQDNFTTERFVEEMVRIYQKKIAYK
jgi:hypothetical protein